MKQFICIPGTKDPIARSQNPWKSSPHRFQSCTKVFGAIVLTFLMANTACELTVPSPVLQVSFEGLCGLTVGQFLSMDEQKVSQWLLTQYGSVERAPDLGEGVTRLWAPEKNGVSSTAFLRQGNLIQLVQQTIAKATV